MDVDDGDGQESGRIVEGGNNGKENKVESDVIGNVSGGKWLISSIWFEWYESLIYKYIYLSC